MYPGSMDQQRWAGGVCSGWAHPADQALHRVHKPAAAAGSSSPLATKRNRILGLRRARHYGGPFLVDGRRVVTESPTPDSGRDTTPVVDLLAQREGVVVLAALDGEGPLRRGRQALPRLHVGLQRQAQREQERPFGRDLRARRLAPQWGWVLRDEFADAGPAQARWPGQCPVPRSLDADSIAEGTTS
jgi:hypothetical protein